MAAQASLGGARCFQTVRKPQSFTQLTTGARVRCRRHPIVRVYDPEVIPPERPRRSGRGAGQVPPPPTPPRASSQQVRDRRIALGIIVGTIVGGSFVFGGDDKKAPEPGKPFGFDADGTRIERNTEGRVRVKYSKGGYASEVWEVFLDPYHDGVILLKPRDVGVYGATVYFIDTGLQDFDIRDKGDLRKVFAGELWMRRMRPVRASADSLQGDPTRVGLGLE